jgi:glutamine amidotransferase
MVHPIIDQYYNYNPYHSRSSKYVAEKGLITNEKGVTPRGISPASSVAPEDSKKLLPPSKMHESVSRSLTPEMHSNRPARALSQSPDISKQLLENALSTITTRDSSKPQEQGNTKKKRRSLLDIDVQTIPEPEIQPPEAPAIVRAASPGERGAYGDPAKIAKYFPELHLSG